jgi:hypothetical protein
LADLLAFRIIESGMEMETVLDFMGVIHIPCVPLCQWGTHEIVMFSASVTSWHGVALRR